MPAPEFTLPRIIAQLQTQWPDDAEGSFRRWKDDTVNYAIPDVAPDDYGGGEAAGFDAAYMTDVKRGFAREAFELWDDLIAIDLNEIARPYGSMITFAYSTTTQDGLGYAHEVVEPGPSPQTIVAQRIWLVPDEGNDEDSDFFSPESFPVYSILHEIGHALGLSHPGSYAAYDEEDPTYDDDAEYAQDTHQYTVMSYFGCWMDTDGDGTWQFSQDLTTPAWRLFPATPMLHDIAAIQAMYGADTDTREGDTVYGFNSTADRDVFDFTKNTAPILTIWDAGGDDTLDTSGFTHNQTIDLRQGAFSSIGPVEAGVAIAFGCDIENAIGGSVNDAIFGNALGNRLQGLTGNDTFHGYGGFDWIDGGDGFDTAVFVGRRSEYDISYYWDANLALHTYVRHVRGGADGTDDLVRVERLVFADENLDGPGLIPRSALGISIEPALSGKAAGAVLLQSSLSAFDWTPKQDWGGFDLFDYGRL